jgi:CDP-glucose 4,6-dehydratase
VCATVESNTPAGGHGNRTASSAVDSAFWRGRSVLLTGHTGFKGAWTALWLQSLGARITGVSLREPPTEPSLYALARVEEGMAGSVACDIRDADALGAAVAGARPEIVIHMAAQPLVRRSFADPRHTYETNVMGTVNLLDAVRACESVRAVVVVTSDKCYDPADPAEPPDPTEPADSARGHREGDPLGGHDPYSSSKAAAELVTSAYRRSFFSGRAGTDLPRVASARAGNVIGGGDWGEDRLVPDIVRAALAGEVLRLRNPGAVRPWQHVLCPLGGYLLLAQALCDSPEYARAWNFGPDTGDARTVEWVVARVAELWPGGVRWARDEGEYPHETRYLRLDSSRARELLGWAPSLGLEAALGATVEWYEAWVGGGDMRAVTLGQIAGLA